MLRPQWGEEHFGQKKEQSWAHVSQCLEHRSPQPRAPAGQAEPFRCLTGLQGGSSHRDITNPMEQLFLSPAKATLCNPKPSGCLWGGSSEPGKEKLGPVQSLTAAASSPSPQQTYLVAITRGSEPAGRCWAGEAQGRAVRRAKHPRNPQAPPDSAGSRGGSALPPGGTSPPPLAEL